MATMNRENNRRENEASNHRNNNDPTGDEEENNIHNTRGREEIRGVRSAIWIGFE